MFEGGQVPLLILTPILRLSVVHSLVGLYSSSPHSLYLPLPGSLAALYPTSSPLTTPREPISMWP